MPLRSRSVLVLASCWRGAEAISAWDVGRSARYARRVHSPPGQEPPTSRAELVASHRPLAPTRSEGEEEEEFRPPLSLLCLGASPPVLSASDAASAEPLEFLAFDVNHTAAPGGIAGAGAGHAQVHPLHRSWFAFTLSFALVVKFACMLSNVIFAVSPITQVREFGKLGHTGSVDAAPFISIFYGGWQWCFYGMFAFLETKKSGFLVLIYSNCLSAVLGCYYIWGFSRNCKSAWALLKLKRYWQAVATVVSLQILAILFLKRRNALLLCGLASSVCSVVGACSLLATLPVVLETKCSSTINFPLTVIGFFSSALWLVCGCMLWDAWIILPNIGCLALNACTMSMAIYFPSDPEEARAMREESVAISAHEAAAPKALDAEEAGLAYLKQPSLERHSSAKSLHFSRPATPLAAGSACGLGACSVPSSPFVSPALSVRSPVPVAVVPQYGSTCSQQTALARFWQALPVELQTILSTNVPVRLVAQYETGGTGETGGTM